MRYPWLLWDFDGTLADTLPCLLRIYNEVGPRYGLCPIDDPEAARRLPLRELVRGSGISSLKLPLLLREVFAAQSLQVAGLRLFAGLPGVLEAVHQSGRRMSVLSSNTEANIRTCLGANGVEGLFESVLGYSRLFGKARALRRFVRARGIDRRQVLYVGDEVRDVEAARAAGVAVAAVAWGFNAAELLARHGPDHLVEEPRQLLGLLGG
jgi:phosphoglycolate phosphatase